MIARGMGRQVMGHHLPGASRARDIENAVENSAVGIHPLASVASVGAVCGREEGFEERPFGIGQIS